MDNIIFTKEYIEPKTPYNILSVCVFQMKKSYKKSNTYISGLKYTIDNISRSLPNFYLRVYYDKSIEKSPQWMKVINYAKTKPKVQLVKFEHPWFIDSEGYHLGTFGTVVRLFPLFSNDEPNLRTILVGDVDFNEEMFPYWRKTYEIFKASKSQVHMYDRKCNHVSERVVRIVKLLDLPFSPFLNSFWSKMRFPKTILDTFLKCMHDGKNVNTAIGCKEVDIFITKTDYSKVKKANQMEVQKFMYGIDEICLLKMLRYVLDSKIVYSYHTFPDILLPFRDAYTVNADLMKTPEHEELLKRIMTKYYNSKLSSSDNYTILYGAVNHTNRNYNPKAPKEHIEIASLFARNAVELYKDLLKTGYKQYTFRKDVLQCACTHTLSPYGMTLTTINPNKNKK